MEAAGVPSECLEGRLKVVAELPRAGGTTDVLPEVVVSCEDINDTVLVPIATESE